jgi:hypothetical protein
MIATRLTRGAISLSISSHLPPITVSTLVNPVMFPPGRGRPATNPAPTGSETTTNTIGIVRVSRCSGRHRSGASEDHVGLQFDQLFRESPHPVNTASGPTNVHPRGTAVCPTQLRKPLREVGEPVFCLGIVFIESHQHANPAHPISLLRAGGHRPRHRAAEERDELAPT